MENHGALVGWTHQDLGNRILLGIETLEGPSGAEPREPDILRILMTKNQAGVLGEYLTKVSGFTPPSTRRRGFFSRYLG